MPKASTPTSAPPRRCSKRCRMNARWISSRTPPARTATIASTTNSIRVEASVANGLGEKRPGAQRISTIPVPTASRNTHGTQAEAAQHLADHRPRPEQHPARRLPADHQQGEDQADEDQRVEAGQEGQQLEGDLPVRAGAQAGQRQGAPDQELCRGAGAEAAPPAAPAARAAPDSCRGMYQHFRDRLGPGRLWAYFAWSCRFACKKYIARCYAAKSCTVEPSQQPLSSPCCPATRQRRPFVEANAHARTRIHRVAQR